VNHSDDISWHKNRVFISEVFRFEELAFELITPGLYRVFFREKGELNAEELRFRSARRVVMSLLREITYWLLIRTSMTVLAIWRSSRQG
jgi:hypothetical protein